MVNGSVNTSHHRRCFAPLSTFEFCIIPTTTISVQRFWSRQDRNSVRGLFRRGAILVLLKSESSCNHRVAAVANETRRAEAEGKGGSTNHRRMIPVRHSESPTGFTEFSATTSLSLELAEAGGDEPAAVQPKTKWDRNNFLNVSHHCKSITCDGTFGTAVQNVPRELSVSDPKG